MRTRRSSSRRSGVRLRRKLIWARTRTITPTSIALNTPLGFNLLDEFETQLGAQLIGATIMRIRGHIGVHMRTSGHINHAHFAWGVFVQNSGDVANTPDPLGLIQSTIDWMGYGAYSLWPQPIDSIAVTVDQHKNHVNLPVDIRARRKIDELGQNLRLIRTWNGDANPTVITNHNLSVLVALP